MNKVKRTKDPFDNLDAQRLRNEGMLSIVGQSTLVEFHKWWPKHRLCLIEDFQNGKAEVKAHDVPTKNSKKWLRCCHCCGQWD